MNFLLPQYRNNNLACALVLYLCSNVNVSAADVETRVVHTNVSANVTELTNNITVEQPALMMLDRDQEKFMTVVSDFITHKIDDSEENLPKSAVLLLGQFYRLIGYNKESAQLFSRLSNVRGGQSVGKETISLVDYYLRNGLLLEAKTSLSSLKSSDYSEDYERLLASYYLATKNINKLSEIVGSSNSDSMWLQYARYNLAALLLPMNENEVAKNLLSLVIKNSTADEEGIILRNTALIALSQLYITTRQARLAANALSSVSMSRRDSYRSLLTLGKVYSQNKKYRSALNIFLEIEPRQSIKSAVPEASLLIPRLLSKLGKPEAALIRYNKLERQLSVAMSANSNLLINMDYARFFRGWKQLNHDSIRQNARNEIYSLSQIKKYPYLKQVMVSNEFNILLENYRILERLHKTLTRELQKKSIQHTIPAVKKYDDTLSSEWSKGKDLELRMSRLSISATQSRIEIGLKSLEKNLHIYLVNAISDYQDRLNSYQRQVDYYKASLYENMLLAQDRKL